MNVLDRLIAAIAPTRYLQRVRARVAADVYQRHYEAASSGRRTQNWHRSLADANLATGPYAQRMRDIARDLVRNNPYAENALSIIVDHTVGVGITAKALPRNKEAEARWNDWANTTACDADGRHDLVGLEKLVTRTAAESGECLVRRRLRLPSDGLPIPLQLQVLEPDYLDTTQLRTVGSAGQEIVYGVELDAIGRRVAYWLYPEHPGGPLGLNQSSQRLPASEILHVFRGLRPGQARGMTWFAPVLLRFKDLDELEDAVLMKQKIAACLAVIITDPDGSAAPLGTVTKGSPEIDMLEPGALINGPPGRQVTVVQPPNVTEYPTFSAAMQRSLAAGLGITYEDLTGDYANLPFSAARMSRLRHWARVEDWRWNMIIPQFCDPVWSWAMQAMGIMGYPTTPQARWTAPPPPMIEPDKEGIAYQRNIRSAIGTLSESIRERGYDPEEVFAEMAADWKRIDELGLILDCDPRRTTQAGQRQADPATTKTPTPPAATPAEEGDGAKA